MGAERPRWSQHFQPVLYDDDESFCGIAVGRSIAGIPAGRSITTRLLDAFLQATHLFPIWRAMKLQPQRRRQSTSH